MCMRLEGLPLAAFCCKDPQSDRASAQRLCPKFVPQTWQGNGCLLMAFFGAVFSSVFNCPLGTRVAFQNACFGFYVALLHLAEGKRKYGQAWQSKCLPWQTVRNLRTSAPTASFTACTGPDRPPGGCNPGRSDAARFIFPK